VTCFGATILSRECILSDAKARNEMNDLPPFTREQGLQALAAAGDVVQSAFPPGVSADGRRRLKRACYSRPKIDRFGISPMFEHVSILRRDLIGTSPK
jgi:hypothetical protein